MPDPRPRIFVATPTEILVAELSPELDQAMDVLDAAGILNQKTANILIAAEQHPEHLKGRTLVGFAHHYVSLAAAVHG